MTLLTNIAILVLILAVIVMTMYYTRRLKRCTKEIEARKKRNRRSGRQNKGYAGGRKQDFHHPEENP
mgnify:CR=1 FL=1